MHTRGRPKTMYAEAVYADRDRGGRGGTEGQPGGAAAAAWRADRTPHRRPGLGFAKRPDDSYGVLARLRRWPQRSIDRCSSVRRGSRSCATHWAGRPAPERDWGTAAAVTAAVLAGAHIVRVHAVGEMVQVVRVAEEIRRHAEVTNWLTAVLRRPPISWWDIADIAMVSLLVYELLMLIRGTRAVQMALGGAVIVGLFYLSGLSQLETVNFLIRNFVGYVVFAVIVLFQADIRRALAHLGRAPFFRYFAKEESAEESIEELIVAAGLLSAKRIGAIVAIERQVGLRNYIEGGIPLDAVLTYDLLVSIFQPSSPLHDGAVIVQDDRIAAAACFLPLTVNPKLSKELGSRHRAAIGLTEENDAVAIVVSEETGIVSVVVDGQVERGLDPDALRAPAPVASPPERTLGAQTRRRARLEMAGRV